MKLKLALAAVLAICLSACGPNIKDLEKGESGIVDRVFDGDTLTVTGGLRVKLTGIMAPNFGYAGGPDEKFAKEARAGLEKLALGREVQLAYGGARRYKETTALAQVFVRTEGGRWIWAQEAMLQEGLARARTWKDNFACADKLYAAEAQARKAKRGIWAEKAYAVRDGDSADVPIGGFEVVEGFVRKVAAKDDRTYLNFGDDYRTDFTIAVNAADLAAWEPPALPLAELAGKKVRVRGYVSDRGGPLIFADHPAQIEVLN